MNVYRDPDYHEIVIEMKNKLANLRSQYKDSRELDLYYIDKYLKNWLL